MEPRAALFEGTASALPESCVGRFPGTSGFWRQSKLGSSSFLSSSKLPTRLCASRLVCVIGCASMSFHLRPRNSQPAARRLGRSVSWLGDRSEHFVGDAQGRDRPPPPKWRWTSGAGFWRCASIFSAISGPTPNTRRPLIFRGWALRWRRAATTHSHISCSRQRSHHRLSRDCWHSWSRSNHWRRCGSTIRCRLHKPRPPEGDCADAWWSGCSRYGFVRGGTKHAVNMNDRTTLRFPLGRWSAA